MPYMVIATQDFKSREGKSRLIWLPDASNSVSARDFF
jgi:hypothetical protein